MQKQFVRRRALTGPGVGLVAVALILALGACYPGDISGIEETDVVLTVHSGNDFSAYNTYAMPDTVVDVCENAEDPECDNALHIDHSYDSAHAAARSVGPNGLDHAATPGAAARGEEGLAAGGLHLGSQHCRADLLGRA